MREYAMIAFRILTSLALIEYFSSFHFNFAFHLTPFYFDSFDSFQFFIGNAIVEQVTINSVENE